MSFRGVTATMRATLLAVLVAALVGAITVPRSAATETGPTRAAKAVTPILGVSYRSPRGTLAWFEPMTLRTIPGRKAPLGGHYGSWAFSADRRVLALGSCGGPGAETPGIRFVNARGMRVLGDVPLSPYRGCATSLTWLRNDRLLVVVSIDTANASELRVVNPLTRRVLRRSRLPGWPAAVGRTSEELVLLLSSPGEFAPARLAVVDAEGAMRMRAVERVLAGTIEDETSAEYRARTIQPGLAIDPDGRRAFVVPASGLVAEVDLVTLAVSYHELDRPSLLGRFLRWLTPAAQAKLMEGPVREARWLGDGMLAVSGMDYSVDAGSDQGRLVATPAGVRLIDTRSWTSRLLESEASGFAVAPGLVVAQGGRWDGELDRGFGPGLHAFGLDGRERWQLHAGEYRWMDVAGSVGYAYIDGGRAEVVDLESGNVVARVVGDPLPQLLAGQSSSW
jgi:hypothetical protein